ncbi:hypothetical protein NDU88_002523 [Pleurodeles waltl]|uniref:Uncharacterized protein n=1 Tax=Pleurodeles waltl TaxID=8319 RepID=A0AAV7TKW6_PLEWA|nr:hypothetical protein NDU88_002523 [Pleurodeles waltl]
MICSYYADEACTELQIVSVFRDFYQSLYAAKAEVAVDPSVYLDGCTLTPLPQSEAEVFHKPIRIDKVITAMA